MKLTRIILIAAAALLIITAISARAQTAFQSTLDSVIKDGAVGGGFWRSTSGNINILSYDYLYNITTVSNALGAGLIVGGDTMKDGHNASVWNDVKGGFSINYRGNLQAIGLTNTVFKCYVGNAIATPRGNSTAGVGNITFVGAAVAFPVWKSLLINISPSWQTRTGQGNFDRNYAGIQAFISYGGGSASLWAANDRYLDQEYAVNGQQWGH